MWVWGIGPNGVQGRSPPEADDILFSGTNFLTKLSHKLGKFRLHGERQSVSMRRWRVGHSPTFHILLQLASADCHCTLPGEDRISSNTPIPEFYRTQKLRFNVPRTYLCLIIRNKIGLHPAIGYYRPIQMEPSRCHIIFTL